MYDINILGEPSSSKIHVHTPSPPVRWCLAQPGATCCCGRGMASRWRFAVKGEGTVTLGSSSLLP